MAIVVALLATLAGALVVVGLLAPTRSLRLEEACRVEDGRWGPAVHILTSQEDLHEAIARAARFEMRASRRGPPLDRERDTQTAAIPMIG